MVGSCLQQKGFHLSFKSHICIEIDAKKVANRFGKERTKEVVPKNGYV